MFNRRKRDASTDDGMPGVPPAPPAPTPPPPTPPAPPVPGTAPAPAPVTVPVTVVSFRAHPAVTAVIAAMQRHDWDGARAALMVGSWGDVTLIAQAIVDADEPSVDALLDQWFAARPDDTIAVSVMGVALSYRAWRVRGSGRASTVSDAQFDEFHEILRRADAVSERAWRLDRTNPIAWIGTLIAGMGLSIPLSEMRLRYEQAVRLDPTLVAAHETMFQATCEKWRGSHDEMFAFVAELCDPAPDGSPLHVFRVRAVFELALANDGPLHRTFATSAETVRRAGMRSVLHPAFAEWAATPDGLAARCWFAYAYDMIDDLALAAMMREQLGGRIHEWPWKYHGDPLTVYTTRSYKLQ